MSNHESENKMMCNKVEYLFHLANTYRLNPEDVLTEIAAIHGLEYKRYRAVNFNSGYDLSVGTITGGQIQKDWCGTNALYTATTMNSIAPFSGNATKEYRE